MTTYRVVDAESDDSNGICYLYTRASDGLRKVFKLKSVYLLSVAEVGSTTELLEFVREVSRLHASSATMSNIKEGHMYYRASANVVTIECQSYHTKNRIHNMIKYNSSTSLFLCNSDSTVEDDTLARYGISSCLYVTQDKRSLRPATKAEEFEYTPRVGSFDLEMLSLNPVDPSCVLYMASYVSDKVSVLIYTRDFYNKQHKEDSNVRYMLAKDKAQLVDLLSRVIAKDYPDIVTGYNIYNADTPLLYFTMSRYLQKWHKAGEGPDAYFYYTKKIEKKFVDSDAGTSIRVPGLHMIDMYPFLEETLSRDEHPSLSLGDMGLEFLGEGKDNVTYKEMIRIYYEGSAGDKVKVMRYCSKDALLALRLYKEFNVWNFHSAMYTICGVLPYRLMAKGMVDVTYNMCRKEAARTGTYMDTSNKHIFRPTGGLVFDPIKGYYEDVYCLDVTSMYPSIDIQHNIDSSSCVPLTKELIDTAVHMSYYSVSGVYHILEDSRGCKFAFDTSKQVPLPTALSNLIGSRAQVKTQMLDTKLSKHELDRLKGLEQALKRCANSACGSLGEQTKGNPMSHCSLNDIITTTGRKILQLAKDKIEGMGAKVVYGDTDSVFVVYDGDIHQLIDDLHSALPNRIRFKVEYKTDKFLMGTKKHYVIKRDNKLKIVGYKSVKSSSCKAGRYAFAKLVDVFMDYGPEVCFNAYDSLVDTLHDIVPDIEAFSWRLSYGGKEYSPNNYKGMLINAMMERGIRFVPGISKEVVYVLTEEEYASRYNRSPLIELPNSRDRKSKKIYTDEEVSADRDAIDIEMTLHRLCRSDLMKMSQAYFNNQAQR